jgi:predicted transcriptional regulator
VLGLRSNSLAKADVPPNRSMMLPEVIAERRNENRKVTQALIADCVISDCYGIRQTGRVLTTVELLGRLEDRGIKNADIARALNVSPSRVTELKKGERKMQLDEAAKLVTQFELEESEPPPSPARVAPLPPAISRLIVRYVSEELGCSAQDRQVQEIAEDIRAFAEYVADPKVRGSIDLQTQFFEVMRLRRSIPAEEAQ